MNPVKQHQLIVLTSWLFVGTTLILLGTPALFIFSAVLLFLVMVFRGLKIQDKKRFRFYLIVVYVVMFVLQLLFYSGFFGQLEGPPLLKLFENLLWLFILFLPMLIEYLVTVTKHTEFYLPSAQELNTISFGQLKKALDVVKDGAKDFQDARRALTFDRVKEMALDLPRHSVIRYINNGTLTEAYFSAARESLSDTGIYIVVSSTGSTFSEVISIFTKKQYNHASIAFDRDLATIISYNGGENVYPPGLNQEMIEFFNKKPEASLMVYRLETTRAQKERLIELVAKINATGSAYNILGLLFKTSLRPNIMFCSQFVYNLLSAAGLAYFNKPSGLVKPTDLVELDYYRRLTFCYELMVNDYMAGQKN